MDDKKITALRLQGGYFFKRDIKDGQAKDKAEDKKPSHEVPVPEKKNLDVVKGAYCLDGQYKYDFSGHKRKHGF